MYLNNFSESFDNASSSLYDESLQNLFFNENKENFYKAYKNSNVDDDDFEVSFLKNAANGHFNNGGNGSKEAKSKLSKYNPTIKRNMLKFYAEEEENIALELRQDKRLLSVLAEEAKLTKQLSMEKLIHFTTEFQEMEEDDDTKMSTDFDTTNETERNTPLNVYWKQCMAKNDSADKMCTDSEQAWVIETFLLNMFNSLLPKVIK